MAAMKGARTETAGSGWHRRARAALLTPRVVDPLRSHVSLRDPAACARSCPERCCLYLCPAAVFDPREPGRIWYERCVECGACRLFCPLGNVVLDHPRGGYGIRHRYG